MKIPSSERLQYTLINEKDKQLLFELDQDPEVMRFINGGQPSSMQTIEEWFIPRIHKFTHPDKGWGLWKVNTLAEDVFLGWILVRPMYFYTDSPEYNNLELGWRFKRLSWGQGYASEAAKHIANAISKQEEVQKFSAIAVEDNHASINIMKKLGMTFLKRDHVSGLDEQPVECVFYEKNI